MPGTSTPSKSGWVAQRPCRGWRPSRCRGSEGAIQLVPTDLREGPLVGVGGVIRAASTAWVRSSHDRNQRHARRSSIADEKPAAGTSTNRCRAPRRWQSPPRPQRRAGPAGRRHRRANVTISQTDSGLGTAGRGGLLAGGAGVREGRPAGVVGSDFVGGHRRGERRGLRRRLRRRIGGWSGGLRSGVWRTCGRTRGLAAVRRRCWIRCERCERREERRHETTSADDQHAAGRGVTPGCGHGLPLYTKVAGGQYRLDGNRRNRPSGRIGARLTDPDRAVRVRSRHSVLESEVPLMP